METTKKLTIQQLKEKLNKSLGKEVLFFANEREMKRGSSGITVVDRIIGGGIPKGRMIEIYGPPSGGKSTLTLIMIATAQQRGETCAYIDVENSFDTKWAKRNGVTTEDLLLIDVRSAEAEGERMSAEYVLKRLRFLVENNIDLVIVDSVAAMVVKDLLDKEADEQPKIAANALLMSRQLPVLTTVNKDTTIIFINQVRQNIGTYGNPDTTPGGKALPFYASIRLNVRAKKIERDKEIVQEVHVKVTKNKTAPPYGTTMFEMDLMANISNAEGYHDIAKALDYFGEDVEKKGNAFFLKGEKVANKKEDFIAFLQDRPKLLSILTEQVIAKSNEVNDKGGKSEDERVALKAVLQEAGMSEEDLEGCSNVELMEQIKHKGLEDKIQTFLLSYKSEDKKGMSKKSSAKEVVLDEEDSYSESTSEVVDA